LDHTYLHLHIACATYTPFIHTYGRTYTLQDTHTHLHFGGPYYIGPCLLLPLHLLRWLIHTIVTHICSTFPHITLRVIYSHIVLPIGIVPFVNLRYILFPPYRYLLTTHYPFGAIPCYVHYRRFVVHSGCDPLPHLLTTFVICYLHCCCYGIPITLRITTPHIHYTPPPIVDHILDRFSRYHTRCPPDTVTTLRLTLRLPDTTDACYGYTRTLLVGYIYITILVASIYLLLHCPTDVIYYIVRGR